MWDMADILWFTQEDQIAVARLSSQSVLFAYTKAVPATQLWYAVYRFYALTLEEVFSPVAAGYQKYRLVIIDCRGSNKISYNFDNFVNL